MTSNHARKIEPQPDFVAIFTPFRDFLLRTGLDTLLDRFEGAVTGDVGDFARAWGGVSLSSHVEVGTAEIFLTIDATRPGVTLEGFQDAVGALVASLGMDGVVTARREVLVCRPPQAQE